MLDLKLALIAGIDIPIPACQVILHQPTIQEIAYMGEVEFFQALSCLVIDKNQVIEDKTLLPKINNFQIFMTVMQEKEAQEKKEYVITLLTLLFPAYKVQFLPKSIGLVFEGKYNYIDESNFESFQDIIKQVFCFSSQSMQSQSYNPANKKAKEIAEKIMKGRQRVAAQTGDDKASIFTQYISTIVVGLGSISLKDALELTMFQLFDLMERYGLYMSWDIDIRSRLAGAKIDTKPDNWMKNIH